MSDRTGKTASGGFDGPDAIGAADWPMSAALGGRLDDAVAELADSCAPVALIMAGGRRRQTRTRVVGGSALSVTVLALAVAVGVGTSGSAGGTGSTPGPGSAGKPSPSASPTGETVIAEGSVEGHQWKLVRVLTTARPGDNNYLPEMCSNAPETVESSYFEIDGKRDPAGTGDTGCADSPVWERDFSTSPILFTIARIGVGSYDGSGPNDGGAAPFGSMLSGVVGPQVAKVVLRTSGQADQVATLVPAPAPENGQYFYLLLPAKQAGPASGLTSAIVALDAAGKVLHQSAGNMLHQNGG
jgi:hypothetical protein